MIDFGICPDFFNSCSHIRAAPSQLTVNNEPKIDFFPVIKLLIDAFNVLIAGFWSVY
jgi:hypothetical protein